MSDSLLPMVVVVGLSAVVATSLIVVGHFMGRPKHSSVDRTPYECGMKPFERVETHRFSVHFYLVGMLFILFDVEAAFMFPWAVTFRDLAGQRWFVLGEMAVFLGILVAGFVYLWKRGALEWE
jgi:NADH-quinone oxidoreductase subunit A